MAGPDLVILTLAILLNVVVTVLVAGVGSVTPPPGVAVAVLINSLPAKDGSTVPFTMICIAAFPDGIAAFKLILPVPVAAPVMVAPFWPVAVQLTLLRPAGRLSTIFTIPALLGPALITFIV
ncbi:hypothetical protein D3C85_1051580 [compost metagenome]